MARTTRRAYTGSKRFDASCRNHGGCPWCERNRLYADRRARTVADEQIEDYNEGEDNGE